VEQCSNTAAASGLVGFRQDAVSVLGAEAAARGLGHDFRVGVGGPGERSGNLMVVHQEILSGPAL